MYDKFRLDNLEYDVRIVYGSIKRVFAIEEGSNIGTSVGITRIRDIVGTAYSYSMQIEPNPQNMDSYNLFYEAISSPVDSHIISAPYGNETLNFECCIDTGEDTDFGIFGGQRKWGSLTIVFTPKAPQRS